MSQDILRHVLERPIHHEQLGEWYDAGLNVLLVGEFGTGKTARILKLFAEKAGTKWAFFNGSTIDPWTDLIGIPTVDDSSGQAVIKYVRPAELQDDIEAIYIDETNRAKPATRNALFELIQFKSITGRVFPNLKVVWASINPPADENDEKAFRYDVDELDPAMIDRFHIIVKVPAEPDVSYFHANYKTQGTNLVEWWKQQSAEAKRIISPRRLEYIAKLHRARIDVADALPTCANIKMLKKMIDSSPVINRLNDLQEKRTKTKLNTPTAHSDINQEISALINDENNFEELKDHIVQQSEWKWVKWLTSEEKIDLLFQENRAAVLDYYYQHPDTQSRLFKVINRHMQDDEAFKAAVSEVSGAHANKTNSQHIRYVDNDDDATSLMDKYQREATTLNTYGRRASLESLLKYIPKQMSDSFGTKLLAFLNDYTVRCDGKILAAQYAQGDSEASKLLVLTKLYTKYAADKSLPFKQEAFYKTWSANKVNI